jgi:hypothetical protein
VLLTSAACGDSSKSNDNAPTATSASSTATVAPTTEAIGTPSTDALLDDVIDLAVQLNTMTHDQAVCVFQDHPSIYQEFLQTSGLNRSTNLDEAVLTQQFQDLKTAHAVQLDRCFTDVAG